MAPQLVAALKHVMKFGSPAITSPKPSTTHQQTTEGDAPVWNHPAHPTADRQERRQARQHFGLNTNAALFCTVLTSTLDRTQNPGGASAFKRAFPPALFGRERTDVGLVITQAPPSPRLGSTQNAVRPGCAHPAHRNFPGRQQLLQLYGSAMGFSLRAGGRVSQKPATAWMWYSVERQHRFLPWPPCPPHLNHLDPSSSGAYPLARPALGRPRSVKQRWHCTIASRRKQETPDPAVSKSYRNQFSAHSCGTLYRQRLETLKRINAVVEVVDETTTPNSPQA